MSVAMAMSNYPLVRVHVDLHLHVHVPISLHVHVHERVHVHRCTTYEKYVRIYKT